jgi:hypothetical protein
MKTRATGVRPLNLGPVPVPGIPGDVRHGSTVGDDGRPASPICPGTGTGTFTGGEQALCESRE